jgi:hypothetical protein
LHLTLLALFWSSAIHIHRVTSVAGCLLLLLFSVPPHVVAQGADSSRAPLDLLKPVVANEQEAALHNDCYEYLSQDRSDRTGGHLWTERIIETADVRLRLLLAVDGKPLSPEAEQQERDRLSAIAADSKDFLKKEMVERKDEQNVRHMLDLLPLDFVFDNVRLQDGIWRMDFHPNPAVSPSGMQDQVLHGMSGTVTIDARQMRLLHIDGHLTQPVNIGFGLLASVKPGSHFSSDRQQIDGHWRTVRVITVISGKAALFKSVAKNSDITRTGFHYFDHDLSVLAAVALLLQQPTQT